MATLDLSTVKGPTVTTWVPLAEHEAVVAQLEAERDHLDRLVARLEADIVQLRQQLAGRPALAR